MSLKTPARRPGEKQDLVAYANPGDYASFPQLVRTDDALVLLFQVQNLTKLRAMAEHPHYEKAAVPRWATSQDGGLTWAVQETCPTLGPVRDISYSSAPLKDGGGVSLTFSDEPLRAIIQRGRIEYRPYQETKAEIGEQHLITDLGPFERFYPHGVRRMQDGAILAAGYVTFKSPEGCAKTTVAFLASTDEGRTWRYRAHIPNTNRFDFSEPDVIETRDGRLVALLRVDWDMVPVEQRPDEAKVGYGYFLYQTESADGGRTWSAPVQLSLWGHPPHLLRLTSGNILLVYSYRRPPWEVRAILSRDEGRTWDLTTLRTLHTFTPGNYDMGYPVATQLPDGSIVCAFYGYSTPDVGEKMPHGIFVSVFDEAWLTKRSRNRSESRAKTQRRKG